jgi:hypothetical protein
MGELNYFINNILPSLNLSAQAKARNGIRLADGNSVPAKHLASPAPQFGKRNAIRIRNRIAMSQSGSSRRYC